MKHIEMEVKATKKQENLEVIVKKTAKLNSIGLNFRTLATFLKDVEKINFILKAAINHGYMVEFEILTYDLLVDDTGYLSRMVPNSFRRWFYEGEPQIDHCELDNGILAYHLQPDTRYTPQYHDMVYDYTIGSITA